MRSHDYTCVKTIKASRQLSGISIEDRVNTTNPFPLACVELGDIVPGFHLRQQIAYTDVLVKPTLRSNFKHYNCS